MEKDVEALGNLQVLEENGDEVRDDHDNNEDNDDEDMEEDEGVEEPENTVVRLDIPLVFYCFSSLHW